MRPGQFHCYRDVLNDVRETPPFKGKIGGTGPLDVDFKINVSIDKIILENLNITFGGHSKPKNCTALQKIAIIIPFRNRELHLTYWLFYMHPFLQKQQGDYGIYVVEQHGQSMFNRAKLMNIGYTEAVKDYDYNCFIFSDVDIIPMNLKNLYRCSKYPKHMAHSLDKFNFRLPYKTLFGGIVAFTKEQYLNINGFSNSFWGWGGEDDELYQRVVAAGMIIERAPQNISKAKMMTHMRDPGNERNQKNVPLISKAKFKMHEDGLSSLEYLLISFTRHRLYTKITVDIGKPDDSVKHSLGGSV
ncbi:beta-1,4-galactosyltransferase 1-like [Spea bombifrons]|uniref:beta-1,4-galactosyltransferase 1-like n=1 Tax=Spea bombifrons TaxID=233779 RepID=UPI00234BE9C2|nr:beta-1,4-galactosyltransferase 1-like [Spea bombifrons]